MKEEETGREIYYYFLHLIKANKKSMQLLLYSKDK